MIRRLVLIGLAAALVASCAPSAGAVETAITNTQAALPTPAVVKPPTLVPTATPPPPTATATTAPTPTVIPLADIDLEPLLVLPGDLPAGYTGAQVRTDPPSMFDEMPSAAQKIWQQFEKDGGTAGGVAVFLYEATGRRDVAYQRLVTSLGDEANTVASVGEMAEAASLMPLLESADLVFVRCAAVVLVRMAREGGIDDVTAYAKRLDARLAEVVCGSPTATP